MTGRSCFQCHRRTSMIVSHARLSDWMATNTGTWLAQHMHQFCVLGRELWSWKSTINSGLCVCFQISIFCLITTNNCSCIDAPPFLPMFHTLQFACHLAGKDGAMWWLQNRFSPKVSKGSNLVLLPTRDQNVSFGLLCLMWQANKFWLHQQAISFQLFAKDWRTGWPAQVNMSCKSYNLLVMRFSVASTRNATDSLHKGDCFQENMCQIEQDFCLANPVKIVSKSKYLSNGAGSDCRFTRDCLGSSGHFFRSLGDIKSDMSLV